MIKNPAYPPSAYIHDYHQLFTPGPSATQSIVESEPSTFYDSPACSPPRYVTLRNGVRMPLLGLGTTHSGGYQHESVVFALKKAGYRMIDTARRYGVEGKLGVAIEESNVPRNELFINTKLWPTDFGFNVPKAFEIACQKLKTAYLDSYMIHFPTVPPEMGPSKTVMEETWRELENLYDAGKIRALGVSNFSMEDLDELMESCSVRPHILQNEFHPCQNPVELREVCGDNGIAFCGYCPLAKGRILNLDPVVKIAKAHNKSPAQICIRWSIQNGVCAIPKSRKPVRLLENSMVFDFELTDEEMSELDTLHIKESMKVVNLAGIQDRMDLPDGYKL